MEVLGLYKQSGLVIEGILEEKIDSNDSYAVSVLHISPKTKTINFGDQSRVQTFYVLKGEIEASFADNSTKEVFGSRKFEEGQGWSLMPNQRLKFKTEAGSQLFAVKGSEDMSKLRDESGENPITKPNQIHGLSDYFVSKPWGSERWFVNNGVYVLKGIAMNAGNESSLQVHEEKKEVNLVLKGWARVALGFDECVQQAIMEHVKSGGTQTNFSLPEEEISRIVQFLPSREFGPDQGWTVRPYQIHRVLSTATYFALEVSTPEVDDVIRLKDLHYRPGGRIEEEHKLT